MIKYCAYGTTENEVVQGYLDIICKEILDSIPGIKSILLAGGFGRGEGTLEISNGKIIPINDLEIYLITEHEVDDALINEVANKALAKLDIENKGLDFYKFEREQCSNTFYVDMKAIPVNKLKSLLPMIRYYELKHSSTVIYGEDYRHLIPDYDMKDFPLTEGFRFLLNRMALLVTYFSTDYIKGKMSSGEYKGLKYLACTKAFLACCEGLLILNGKFVPTYSGRAEIFKKCYKHDFPELYKKLPDLAYKVEEATKFKLNPNFDFKEDPFEIWMDAAHHIGEVTKYFVSRFANINIENYHQLSQVIYKKLSANYFGKYGQWLIKRKTGINLGTYLPALIAKNYMSWSYYTRLKKFRQINNIQILKNPASPDLMMYASLPELIYSIKSKETIDSQALIRAHKLINSVLPTKINLNKTNHEIWNHLADQYANAFIIFSFLRIV